MAGDPNYREERVRDHSVEEEAVKQNYEAQGWEFIAKVDDASSPGYVVLQFKKQDFATSRG